MAKQIKATVKKSDYLPIRPALRGESQDKLFNPSLGWIHYSALMHIRKKEAWQFYEINVQNDCCDMSQQLRNKDF